MFPFYPENMASPAQSSSTSSENVSKLPAMSTPSGSSSRPTITDPTSNSDLNSSPRMKLAEREPQESSPFSTIMSDNAPHHPENTVVSTVPSRASSLGREQQRQRGAHRVKFSVEDGESSLPKKPLPSILLPSKESSSTSGSGLSELMEDDGTDTDSDNEVNRELANRKRQVLAVLSAHERAQRLANSIGTNSAPASRRSSADFEAISELASPALSRNTSPSRQMPAIELTDISNGRSRSTNPSSYNPLGSHDDTYEKRHDLEAQSGSSQRRHRAESAAEAQRLVRAVTGDLDLHRVHAMSDGLQSGQMTPIGDGDPDSFIPHHRPEFKMGILAALLSLRDAQPGLPYSAPTSPRHSKLFPSGKPGTATPSSSTLLGASSTASGPSLLGTPGSSPTSSGYNTPRRPKWYDNKKQSMSTTSLSSLLAASTMMATPGSAPDARPQKRPALHSRTSSGGLTAAITKMQKAQRLQKAREEEHRITLHVADVISRQRYLLKLCKALMLYGAPTHRLEQYLTMSAKVLGIKGQFLYLPGCMLISFDDFTTHTAEVRFVRTEQFVDLGKMMDIHNVYKEVVHDMIGVEEAVQRIEAIDDAKPKFNLFWVVPLYGLCSTFVGRKCSRTTHQGVY